MTTPRSKHLLIIGLHWPEPTSSAAGSRMMQLIQLFQTAGWEISFCCSAQPSPHSENLKSHAITTFHLPLNDPKAKQLLGESQPDAVLFDRFMVEEQFGWQVAEACPKALRILDTEDLHFLRKARHQAVKEGKSYKEAELHTELAKRELAAILRSDISLMISEVERQLLIEQFAIPEEQLWYLPFLVPPMTATDLKQTPGFAARRHLLFIGNFLHAPNYDAVLQLKTKIWPQLRLQLPQTQVHIYGAYTSQKVQQLHRPEEGFVIKGRAEDAAQVMRQAKLLVAPLRFGAGLKGKFLEAMQNGTPAITTSVGAEGLCGDLPFNGAIVDNSDDFIAQTQLLYQDEITWEKARQQGVDLINTRFDKALFTADFVAKLDTWLKDLPHKRQRHFLGQVMMHHRQQSTKYLSRWITLKNKVLNS